MSGLLQQAHNRQVTDTERERVENTSETNPPAIFSLFFDMNEYKKD
jgi:hypothetical protein